MADNNFGAVNTTPQEIEEFFKKHDFTEVFDEILGGEERTQMLHTRYQQLMSMAMKEIDAAPEDLQEAIAPTKKWVEAFTFEMYKDTIVYLLKIDIYQTAQLATTLTLGIFPMSEKEMKDDESDFLEFVKEIMPFTFTSEALKNVLDRAEDAFMQFTLQDILACCVLHVLPEPIVDLFGMISELGIDTMLGIIVPQGDDEDEDYDA